MGGDIAVRTAVSKMRKRDWHNVSLESVTADAEFDPRIAADTSERLDQTNNRSQLLSKLKELIDSKLTEKQWAAITAELRACRFHTLLKSLQQHELAV